MAGPTSLVDEIAGLPIKSRWPGQRFGRLEFKMAIDTRHGGTQPRLRDQKLPFVAALLFIVLYGIVMLIIGIVHLAFY